jgi:lipopolysaccharide transport protein LptA
MFYLTLFLLFFSLQAHADFMNDFPINSGSQTEDQKSIKHHHNKIQKKQSAPNDKKNLQENTQDHNSSKNVDDKTSSNQLSQDLGAHDSNAPVYFSGNHGDGSRVKGILNLIGNVVISQDNAILKSDKAQIISLPGMLPSTGGSRIQRAIATGNVHIVKKASASSSEMTATGDEVEFIVLQRILILKGKAKVWKASEYLNGDKIKINLNTGDVEIIRPEGIVDPRSANSQMQSGNSKTLN